MGSLESGFLPTGNSVDFGWDGGFSILAPSLWKTKVDHYRPAKFVDMQRLRTIKFDRHDRWSCPSSCPVQTIFLVPTLHTSLN